jgi:hypothetical protein
MCKATAATLAAATTLQSWPQHAVCMSTDATSAVLAFKFKHCRDDQPKRTVVVVYSMLTCVRTMQAIMARALL